MEVRYRLTQTVRSQEQTKVYESDVTVEQIDRKDIYLKYEEALDEHKLNVVMRIGDHDIRLSRRGIITMNFHFIEGVYTDTFYESPAGRHHFRLFTRKINADIYRVEIDYDLYEGEACIGQYLYILEKSEENGS